jgi:hypothetical protein
MPPDTPPLSQRLTPLFSEQLDRFTLPTLEQEQGAVFALDQELRLCYLNPAWFGFAHDNHGEPEITQQFPPGTPLSAAIQGPLRDFYLEAYRRVLSENRIWEHDYECSSATVFRRFHQKAYPLGNGKLIVVINNLVVNHPYHQEHGVAMPPDEQRYRNQYGLLVQCSHCRRVQRADEPDHWDWVPEWVKQIPPDTSHSLCYPCYEYFFRFLRSKPAQ